MTTTLDPRVEVQPDDPRGTPRDGTAHADAVAASRGAPAPSDRTPNPAGEPGAATPAAVDDAPAGALRPLLAAGLASAAAAVTTGGIFGTWSARALAVGCVAAGTAWEVVVLRAGKRRTAAQAALFPILVLVAALSVLPEPPAQAGDLVSDAVAKGRLLRPPVPFDAGWRPVLIVLITLLAHGNAAVAVSMRKPRLALVLPVPIIFLTAITQPKAGEAIAGTLSFLLMLAALSVLFRGDLAATKELTKGFELKRALRAVLLGAVALAVLVGLNQTSFLFPKPAYNPAQKPQKPKAVPLSEAVDRVLFEVESEAPPVGISGPWRLGALDVYDGKAWRLPPFDDTRLKKVSSGKKLPGADATSGAVSVRITVRDLGKSPQLPSIASPNSVQTTRRDLRYDPRTQTLRVATGTVPAGLRYELRKSPYPTADALRLAPAADAKEMEEFLEVPKPPPSVRALLAAAPGGPWSRLDFLRAKLNEVVVSAGAGIPRDVTPAKVEDLLTGSHEGTPYEIVAAEALLARWAGVPARIGFGFDGFNDEAGTRTVRPKNGANWLETYFEGFGWVPIVGSPPKAKFSLDNDPNTKFDPTVQPSDDVSLDIYLAVKVQNFRQFYQTIRAVVFGVAPFVIAAVAVWLSQPALARFLRLRRRRAWAAATGPQARIAVEYAEFRDRATDLNVGDPHDTALEYLDRLDEDEEHQELAWLVARTLYGDLGARVGDDDVGNARRLATSLQARLAEGQTRQTRVLAWLSRASLRQPYLPEIDRATKHRAVRRAEIVEVGT